MSGCVSLSLPSIAHVHIGHALGAWSDTPQRRGLLPVALGDAAVLLEHANFAVQGARDVASVRLHLGHVLHALDPALEAEGPGSGYGLLKALGGTLDHLGFAGAARDASAHLRAGLVVLLDSLRPLLREAQLLVALARDGRRSGDAGQALAYALETQQRATTLLAQLTQARQQLEVLLAAEAPPYRPVAERYLFGVIRLPSGEWIHADRPQRQRGY